MKMFEVLELSKLYNSIKDTKLPLKTSYKFARLMHQAESELAFYQQEFQKIVQEYGIMEDGQYKMSEDGNSILIKTGYEAECNSKLQALHNLEVVFEGIEFTIDELGDVDVSISELNCLMSLIKD